MAVAKHVVSASFAYETQEEKLDIRTGGERLNIGIPKETAFQENRIGLTPEAVGVLVNNDHEVIIETNAGEGSHYTDKDFSDAGAKIAYDKTEVSKAPILIKSAPFKMEDCVHLKADQIVISPLHFSLLTKEIIEVMMQKRMTDLSFENLKD